MTTVGRFIETPSAPRDQAAELRDAAKRMERAAEESWTQATALAEFLARRGVAFHRAHQVVGALVLESEKRGWKPAAAWASAT